MLLNYVLLADGELVVVGAGSGHIDAAEGQDVLAAGELMIEDHQIEWITNKSGHHLPSGRTAERLVAGAFLLHTGTPDRMARFCRRIGYSGRVDPNVLHERLQRRLLNAASGSIAGHSAAALALADQVELLNAQLKTYDDRIWKLFTSHPDAEVFASFPAVGPVLGPALLADIGEDRQRFPTHHVLLAEAGLAPVTLASGKVQRVRIRYACNKRLRSTCDSWAYTLKRIDEPTRQRYIASLERGHTKHRALRGVGATWVRRLWRAWQDHAVYDASKRFDLTS